MDQPTFLPVTVVVIATLIAALTDLREFKIYNKLTVPLLVSGLTYHALTGGTGPLLWSILGVIFGFGILAPFYVMGGLGGGDVKLLAGVGAWLGGPLTCYVFVAAGLAAAVYAMCLILFFGKLSDTWVNLRIIWHRVGSVGRFLGAEDHVEVEVNRASARTRLVPFGVMVALGTIVTLMWYQFGVH